MQDEQVKEMLEKAYRRDAKQTHSRVHMFAKKIRSEHADCMRYRRFHLLIGSTPSEECDCEDFPDEQVLSFIRTLEE